MLFLQHIPKSDWFCPDCKPKIAPAKTPRKHRKSFVEEESEEEEEEEEEASEEEEADSSEEEEDR